MWLREGGRGDGKIGRYVALRSRSGLMWLTQDKSLLLPLSGPVDTAGAWTSRVAGGQLRKGGRGKMTIPVGGVERPRCQWH